jgi:WD40 repeat protein
MMTSRRTFTVLVALALGSLSVVPRLAADDLYGDPLPAGALARLGTMRLRHGETAELVAFQPGGKSLLTLSGDGVVRVWDVETGKLQRQFKTRPDNNNNMRNFGVAFIGGAAMAFSSGIQGGTAISADGKTLAVRPSWDGTVQVWDTVAGKELRKIDASQTNGGLAEIGISPDGKTVATRNYDNSIRLIDVATGKKVRELGKKPDNNNGGGFYGGNMGLTFSPDGKMLVSTAGENVKGKQVWSLILHDTATGKELRRISSEDQNAMPMNPTFTPDGKTLVYTRWDGSIHFADPATGKELRQIKDQNGWGTEFLIAPDVKTLLVKNQTSGLRVLEFATGKEQRKFDRRAPQQQVFWNNGSKGGLAMSADGKLAAVAGEDHAVRLFDLATGKEREFGGGHRAAVVEVRYAADGKSITTRSQDGTLRVWNAAGKEQKQIKAPQGAYHFTLSPNGEDLLVGDQSNTASIREAATNKVVRTLPGPKEGIGAVAYSPNGKVAAVYGTADKGVSIWLYDARIGKQLRQIKLPTPGPDANGNFGVLGTGVAGMTISPDGRLIAAVTSHNTLGLWETETGRELTPIQAPDQHAIRGAIFAPDSRCLVLDFGDDLLRLWEIASGKERRQYGKRPASQPGGGMMAGMVWFGGGVAPMPFMRPAAASAVSPNGRLLAQARENHSVSIWDLVTGQELAQLKGHEGTVETVAFAPDGKTLVTGSRDTTGLVWDLSKLAVHDKQQTVDANLEKRWKELAGDDARAAFEAIHALAGLPAPSVVFLKEHVPPAAAVDAAKVAQLIADLDNDRFDVRKQASADLEKLGEPVIPALRQALEGDPSAEVRKRIEALLTKTSRNAPRGEALRSLRAVEVLETIGTPEARAVLQTLAQGVAEASLTRAAQGALERLGRGS